MPMYSQGDIFTAITEQGRADLAIIFGYIGLNEMNMHWRNFASQTDDLKNVKNPFAELSGEPQRVNDTWLWFIPAEENHGMTESSLIAALDEAFAWAKSKDIRRVLTNGVMNTDHGRNTEENRSSDDVRVQFLSAYAAQKERVEDFEVELISLNDAFTRNPNPA